MDRNAWKHRLTRASLQLFIATITVVAPTASAQTPRFVPTAWPWGGGTISTFAVEPSGCILAAARVAGLFRSCDGGMTWTTVRDANGAIVENVSDVFVDSATGTIFTSGFAMPLRALFPLLGAWEAVVPAAALPARYVLAGADSAMYAAADDGVYRSDDRGRTWSRSFQSPGPMPESRSLAVDRTRNVLYLLAGTGLMRSINGGETWERIGDSIWSASRPLIGVTAAGSLIIANEHGQVLRSVDSGRTWSTALPASYPEAIRSIHVGPSGRIFLGAGGGRSIFSEDDGLSWRELEPDSSGKPLISLLELPDSMLFGAIEFDKRSIVRRKGESGAWQFSGHGISDLVIGPPSINTDGAIFVTQIGSGLFFRSDDEGRSWRQDSTGVAKSYSMALGTTQQGTLLVGLVRKGVARRELGKDTWSISSESFGATFERDQSWFDTDLKGRVWVGTESGAFSSTDDGVTWYPTMQGLKFTAVATRADGLVLLGTGDLTGHELLYRSDDGGASYEKSNEGITSGVRAIRFLPSGDALAATERGLLRSIDDGRTWARVPVDPRDTVLVSMVTDRFGAVYVATRNALYVSRDSAQSWVRWTEGLSGSIKHLAIDSNGVLFVATGGAGVLRSETGVAWAPTREKTAPVAPQRLTVRLGRDAITTVDSRATDRIDVEVYTATGRLLHHVKQEASHSVATSVVLPTASLSCGVYFARIRTEDQAVLKVIHIKE
jgi:photosystem II stability/assembly factor-like uncharacterized protein